MPEMISLRNYRLSSTTGHVVLFEANKARDVPAAIVQEALAAGCALTDPNNQPKIDDTTKPKFPLEGDIRRSAIYLALASIAVENKTKHFDAGGTPKADVLSARVGFDVAGAEYAPIWRQYMEDKGAQTTPVLHPKAGDVLRVVDAAGSQDLLHLAGEIGVPEAAANGMTSRELRAALITKLVGKV